MTNKEKAFIEAAKAGNIVALTWHVSHGVNINITDENGRSTLFIAEKQSRFSCVGRRGSWEDGLRLFVPGYGDPRDALKAMEHTNCKISVNNMAHARAIYVG